MFEPMGSRVLVEPRKIETETKSGIIIATNKNAIQQIGEVISVGRGHVLENGERFPISVNPGDIVMFAKYAGTTILHKDKQYLLLEEADILGRITED